MNVYTLFALFAAALLLSTVLTLAGGRIVLSLQEKRLRARGCRCERTLFVDYLRSDCPVHGWQIDEVDIGRLMQHTTAEDAALWARPPATFETTISILQGRKDVDDNRVGGRKKERRRAEKPQAQPSALLPDPLSDATIT